MTNFTGTSGNDNFNGTTSIDSFDLSQGGDDIAFGDLGIDSFLLGAALDAADALDGGAGNDALNLAGNYNLVLGATTLVSIESITLTPGFDYQFTTNDANIAATVLLQIDGHSLGAGDTLTIDGSAETDGRLRVTGGAGNDKVTGGTGDDILVFSGGGSDKEIGSLGNDAVSFSDTSFDASDRLDGGVGLDDTLSLNADYAAGVTLGGKTIRGIESITLSSGHTYKLIFHDGNVAAGATLEITSLQIHVSTFIKMDGSAETDGAFIITGATGADVLIGGAGADELTGNGNTDRLEGGGGNDILTGNAGGDQLEGGAGADTYECLTTADSASTTYDVIIGFDANEDVFDVAFGGAGAVDPTVGSGRLSTGNFENQLAHALDAAQLTSNNAVIFKPDEGNLAGHIFLIVDRNGVPGYQAGQEHVFELVDPVHLGALSIANII